MYLISLKELLAEEKEKDLTRMNDVDDDYSAADEEKSYDEQDYQEGQYDSPVLNKANLLSNTNNLQSTSNSNKPAPLLNLTKINEKSGNIQ